MSSHTPFPRAFYLWANNVYELIQHKNFLFMSSNILLSHTTHTSETWQFFVKMYFFLIKIVTAYLLITTGQSSNRLSVKNSSHELWMSKKTKVQRNDYPIFYVSFNPGQTRCVTTRHWDYRPCDAKTIAYQSIQLSTILSLLYTSLKKNQRK